jgi:excisionase family DNA binding protein
MSREFGRIGYMRRLLNRDEAAEYIGVSASTLDRLVADGIMPPARALGDRRVVWDRISLDRCIDELPIKTTRKASSWGEALGKN